MLYDFASPCNNIHRHVEDFGHLQNRVDVAAGCGSHMVGGAGLAPAVAELAGTAAEAGAHIRIAEGEDGAGLVDALGHHKLEVAVLILRDGQIGL